ncbi:hypothetical protein DPMN_009661 [Dreissena polymorpha]|uniref:Uncharacterized protein n=1 Tax=Dreissena polymorpha TaxID=45954 RepID=A0A9D4N015_DREPO|nr:hypothetical protein DPMN_009661 [Dreissena polymorpha]
MTALITRFHDDWAKNVTSRKNAPPTGSHVFSPIWSLFELVRDINKTNVLTNFHDDWAKILTSRVFTRKTAPPQQPLFTCFHYIHIEKNAPPTGGHVFLPILTIFELIVTSRVFTSHVIQLTGTIFKLNSHIKGTYFLTKFHEKWAKNVTSKKNAPPTGGHVFSPIWTIFELVQDIIKTNVLTNFHDDWAKIVTSRVFTSLVIELTRTVFELYSHIKDINVLTKFHENWAKNVTFRVLTCFHYIHIEKNAPPTGGHVFSRSGPFSNSSEISIKPILVIELTRTDINVLTKFHENWAKNVTFRVFTCFHYIHIEKNAPPTGGHVFSPSQAPAIWTIFELVRDINQTNVLTNFHDDWAKIVTSKVKTAPPTGGHVFQQTRTTFELNQHIIKTNILTNFELDRDFIGTKLLTKFHEDRK